MKKDLKALQEDFKTLQKVVENSSLFSKDEASGLIRGRGRPPKGDKHLAVREAKGSSGVEGIRAAAGARGAER